MKKFAAYLIAIVLIAAAAVAIFLAINSKDDTDKKSTNSNSGSSGQKATSRACNIFTLSNAKELMGDTAKGGQNPITESSSDIAVSTCTYTQDQGANVPVASRTSATLLVRAPLSDKGAVSNQNQFGPLKPGDVQEVPGYGDNAYWDSARGQLNILKNNTWYILNYGPVTPADRTLDQTEQMAKLIIDKM
jgi:hypothetical protein